MGARPKESLVQTRTNRPVSSDRDFENFERKFFMTRIVVGVFGCEFEFLTDESYAVDFKRSLEQGVRVVS